jgi:hypothetical protein
MRRTLGNPEKNVAFRDFMTRAQYPILDRYAEQKQADELAYILGTKVRLRPVEESSPKGTVTQIHHVRVVITPGRGR